MGCSEKSHFWKLGGSENSRLVTMSADMTSICSPNSVDLGPITSKWSKIDLYSLRRKCSPNNLVFSDISFMAIFEEVTENEQISDSHFRDILYIHFSIMTRLKVSLYALDLIEIGLSALCGFSVRP